MRNVGPGPRSRFASWLLALLVIPALLLGMAQLRLFHRVAIDFGTRRILFAIPDSVAH